MYFKPLLLLVLLIAFVGEIKCVKLQDPFEINSISFLGLNAETCHPHEFVRELDVETAECTPIRCLLVVVAGDAVNKVVQGVRGERGEGR